MYPQLANLVPLLFNYTSSSKLNWFRIFSPPLTNLPGSFSAAAADALATGGGDEDERLLWGLVCYMLQA